MWQILDIAYIIPASVFLAVFIADFLADKYHLSFKTPLILIFAFLGFILTIVKIKKFIDSQENK